MKINREKKSQRINYGLTILIFVLLSAITLGFFQIYPKIYESTEKKYQTYDDYQFHQYLGKFNYVLLNETLEKPEEFEALTKQYLNLQHIAEEDKERVSNAFVQIMKRWKQSLQDDAPNLKYYVVNNESAESVTNEASLKDALTAEKIEEIAKSYDYLVVIQFNAKGIPSIQYVKGATASIVQESFDTFIDTRDYRVSEYFTENIPYTEEQYQTEYQAQYGDLEYYTYEEYRNDVGVLSNTIETNTYAQYEAYREENLIQPIRNATYVYGIPIDGPFYDEILDTLKWNEQSYYDGLNITCLLVLLGMAVVLGFVIPYQYEKNMAAARVILRICVECLVLLGVGAGIFLFFVSHNLIPELVNGSIAQELRLMGISDEISKIANTVMLFGGIMVTLGIGFEGMVLIKHIFHEGIFRYFRDNIFVIQAIRRTYRGIKNAISRLLFLDFSDSGRNRLRIIMFVHTIITIVLCCTWVFGVFFAIGYNLIVYGIIRNKYLKMRDDYNQLLQKTKNIADGNLDGSIEEELGIYNPIRDEINNIREGLKKAVEEEVKSQNMKTELISNVSHDLKTPLTSIITYVDLLKHGQLGEEQQKEYIDILDRKSQRLKVLIEDLFEMSKTTSKNLVLNYMNLDLITLTKEVLVEFEDKLKEANLVVKSNYQAEKVICYLDSQKSFRIIENLIGNIIKYAMPYTRVYVTVTVEEEQGIMTFKNVSASELNCQGEQLMERFVRGDASRNTEGSGLGLAIARGLTEAQGGSIQVDVDGDLFKVTLKFPISTVIEETKSEHPIDKTWDADSELELTANVSHNMSDTKESEWKEEDWVKAFYDPIPSNKDEIAKVAEDKKETEE